MHKSSNTPSSENASSKEFIVGSVSMFLSAESDIFSFAALVSELQPSACLLEGNESQSVSTKVCINKHDKIATQQIRNGYKTPKTKTKK